MQQQTPGSALLVMDMQAGIVARLQDATTLLANNAKAIAAARSKNMPVFYVVVGFRPGAPEVSLQNKGFAAGKAMFASMDMAAFMAVHEAIAPQPGDVTVVKRRVSAFTGSDLEVILRAFNVGHLVLTGIATSGVVLSTLREASDKDYVLTVLADCCADMDDEVHQVLTTKVFPRQADVVNVEQWANS